MAETSPAMTPAGCRRRFHCGRSAAEGDDVEQSSIYRGSNGRLHRFALR
jgi:hypothetical protein